MMPGNMSWAAICFILLIHVYCCYTETIKCPCQFQGACNPIDDWNTVKREVFAMTDKSNSSKVYHAWNWDSITTVVKMHDQYDPELFCFTHAKGKKYGVQVELDFSIYLLNQHTAATSAGTSNKTDTTSASNTTTTNGTNAGNNTAAAPQSKDNSTYDLLEDFVNTTVKALQIHFADVLVLDLIKFLGNCAFAKEHEAAIITNTTTIITGIKSAASHLKVVCVVPWKPPCYDSQCNVGPALAQACDAILLNPESYESYCGACIARATVPYSKLLIGFTDYMAIGFDPSQLLIGIPWHGYKYTCGDIKQVPGVAGHVNSPSALVAGITEMMLHLQNGHYICKLPQKQNAANVSVCDTDARQKLKFGETWLNKSPDKYSKVDQARWRVEVEYDSVAKKNVTRMYWYEDVGSLTAKYQILHDFNVKGIAIYTADDLVDTKLPTKDEAELDEHLWSWVLHGILMSGPVEKKEPTFNYAGTVAGVGVGMFLFGTLLGTLISCIIFRRKRSLRPPFHHDTLTDEFHDDDNAL